MRLAKPKILMAGGCHLAGYLVGQNAAIPQMAAAALTAAGIQAETAVLTHVPLHRPERVSERMRAFQPDVLVLQVGHYETQASFASLVRPTNQSKIRRSSSSHGDDPPKFGGVSWSGWPYRLWGAAKLVLDRALSHRLVDFTAFERKMLSFCQAISDSGARAVLMLSPLPCADPLTGWYRRRAAPFYETAARRFGFHYLDCSGLRPSPGDHRFAIAGFFADPVHLGIEGHRAVGSLLGAALREILLKQMQTAAQLPSPYPTSAYAK